MNVGLSPLAGAALLGAVLAACSSTPEVSTGGPCQLPPATSLSVVKVDPPSGATGVFAGTNVSVSFNTCIDPASVTAQNFLLAGGVSLGSGTPSYYGASATGGLQPAPQPA